MSDATALTACSPPSRFELVQRAPGIRLGGIVSRITGYRELATGHLRQVETASLIVPLIISFGGPFAIGLGRTPGAGDRVGSFAAGLFAGRSSSIHSDARIVCKSISRRLARDGFSTCR